MKHLGNLEITAITGHLYIGEGATAVLPLLASITGTWHHLVSPAPGITWYHAVNYRIV